MTIRAEIEISPTDNEEIANFSGSVVLIVSTDGKLNTSVRRVNKLTRGALVRFLESDAFEKLKEAEAKAMAFPTGLASDQVLVVKLSRTADVALCRKAGAAISRAVAGSDALIMAGRLKNARDLLLGAVLRTYKFSDHKTEEDKPAGKISLMLDAVSAAETMTAEVNALAEGVFFTRDLVNEPANVLTTFEFAERLKSLSELGVEVEVLEEEELEKLGMRTLLAVGQGSDSPSKVVVMQWNGGGTEAPFALVGKGVVFDTGGISLKPALGMEEMTMDMGGAGTVAGVMKALALRKAKANVVGLVGLVENMPDGRAQRPGDVVRSMKGDTVEVINTDAEGRLVLCDVLWYTQERFNPTGMIDLATLTGAIVIALGHENAGVFSNDDALCNAFLKAAEAEGEGAWRMPLGAAYDELLKSNVADVKNTGGRPGGSVTAARFLQRFVKDETPWIHLDIAGVASLGKDATLSPKGATGWGVLALDRLIRNRCEG